MLVRESAQALGCDEAFIALPALAVLGAAIGTTRAIELKASWREFPIVWTVVVAPSGSLKSPSFDMAVHPLHSIQEEKVNEHSRALHEYEVAKLVYEKNLARWRTSREDGDPPEAPQRPHATRYLTTDATVEAVAGLLQHNQRGLLLARDELAAWLRSFDRYSGSRGADEPAWLELYRGGALTVDRKTAAWPIYVRCAAVSVTGTTQPMVLGNLLNREQYESGLAARLLLAAPPARTKRWTERTPAEATLRTYEGVVRQLVGLEFAHREQLQDGQVVVEQMPKVLRMSDAARPVWVDWYNRHALRIASADEREGAMLAKVEGAAARFALIFTLTVDASSLEVPRWAVDAGCRLANWFADEAQRVYCMLHETDEQRRERQLVQLVMRLGGRATVRKLTHRSRLYAKAADAEAALQRLVDSGTGRWEQHHPGAAGGRPTREFVLKTSP